MIEVLYEDNHLLILNKKAGELMQKGLSSQADLESEAKAFIKKRDAKKGGVFLHAVHRLDKPVSGIALFAKTKKSLQRLNAEIRNGLFKKTYFALIEGAVPEKGVLIHYLYHGNFRAEVSLEPKKGYKEASLNYRLLRKGKQCSLVEIDLLSGRYHQIRAQFSFIGNPIVFDEKYGSRKKGKMGEILLHHGKLTFLHPVSKETLVITSPMPPQFMKLLALP